MRTPLLLIVLSISIGSAAQYRTNKDTTDVEIYDIENHKKRKAVARVMDVVGASGIVTYFVLKEKYKTNNLYMPKGVLYGSASLLALGLTVEMASLSKVGKPRRKQRTQQVPLSSESEITPDITEGPLQMSDTTAQRRIEIDGLDRFKKQATTAKVLQVLGTSALLYYFIQTVSYNNQVDRSLDNFNRSMQEYLQNGSRGNPPIYRGPSASAPSAVIPAVGAGVITLGFLIDIGAINRLDIND